MGSKFGGIPVAPQEEVAQQEENQAQSKFGGIPVLQSGTAARAESVEFSPLEMIKNYPTDVYNTGKGVRDMMLSPVQTGKAVYNLGKSAFAKGEGALADALPNKVVEFVNKINNSFVNQGIPLARLPETKEEMTATGTEAADQVWQAIKDKYGTWDKALIAIEQEPFQAQMDISGVLLGGSTLAPKLGKLGTAIDPVNMAKNTAISAGKLIPKGKPRDMMMNAVKFPPSMPRALKERLVETSLKHGLMPTADGIEKAQALIDSIHTKVEGLIDEATQAGKKVPYTRVFSELKSLRKEQGGALAEAPEMLARIDDAARTFDKHMRSRGQTHMTPTELQAFKLDLYEKIFGDKKAMRSIPEKDASRVAMAQGSRKEIERLAPGVGEYNATEGPIIEWVKNVEQPANRIDNHDAWSLGQTAKIGGGYGLAGELGAAAGLVAGLMGKPKRQAANAIRLANWQKAAGTPGRWTSDSMPRTAVQQGAYQAGNYMNPEETDFQKLISAMMRMVQ